MLVIYLLSDTNTRIDLWLIYVAKNCMVYDAICFTIVCRFCLFGYWFFHVCMIMRHISWLKWLEREIYVPCQGYYLICVKSMKYRNRKIKILKRQYPPIKILWKIYFLEKIIKSQEDLITFVSVWFLAVTSLWSGTSSIFSMSVEWFWGIVMYVCTQIICSFHYISVWNETF